MGFILDAHCILYNYSHPLHHELIDSHSASRYSELHVPSILSRYRYRRLTATGYKGKRISIATLVKKCTISSNYRR